MKSYRVYTVYMGLIGLLVTVLLMILGAGYFFFGSSSSQISLTNDTVLPDITQELSRYEEAKKQSEDVKNLVEQKATETMKSADDPTSAPTPSVEMKKVESDIEQPGIINRLMSTGFSVPSKPRTIDTIVLHSSYDLNGSDPYSVSGVIKEYTDYGVSAHYLIDRKGNIYRLVEDKNIAYHAGVSKMPDNRKNVNDFSIGIEMMNTETGQFTNAQYGAVNNLIASLKKKYPIKSVVGHSDIAPDRKTDPWNFDWKRLQ